MIKIKKTAFVTNLFILLSLAFSSTGTARPSASPLFQTTDLTKLDPGRVTRVIAEDPPRLELTDGRVLRLAGLAFPTRTSALGRSARAELESLTLGRLLVPHAEHPDADRHGWLVVHVLDGETGEWIQGRLLDLGLARLQTRVDDRALAATMAEREDRARRASRGQWAMGGAPVSARAPDAMRDGAFTLVEGRIASATRVGNRIYLNFGKDWRTDFTVSFPKDVLSAFHAMGRRPLEWTGQWVRVRGWVTMRNGPMITLTHPEALEGPNMPVRTQ